MYRIVSLLFLVLVGCASGPSRPSTISRPDIQAALASPLHFSVQNVANATVDVRVHNTATVPITIRRIAVDSPGMALYAIVPSQRTMAETIAPGETRSIPILTSAVSNTSRPGEPLMIRTVLEFEANGKRWREVVMTRDTDPLL